MYQAPSSNAAPPAAPQRLGSPVDPLRLLMHAWRLRWIFVVVVLAGGGAGVILAKTLIASDFVSRAVVERESAGEPSTATEVSRDLATFAESLRIETTLSRVREELN